MATWWLAIDTKYTSYDELKHRKVVAQGWPDLGDLSTIVRLVRSGNQNVFLDVVNVLEKIEYGQQSHASKVMWNLLSIRQGDLVVGIEGTVVKGVCELDTNGWESYRCFFPESYNYAQTIGFPVKWEDWSVSNFGFTPTYSTCSRCSRGCWFKKRVHKSAGSMESIY